MKLISLITVLFTVSSVYANEWNEKFISLDTMKIRLSWKVEEFIEGEAAPFRIYGFRAKPLYAEIWLNSQGTQTPSDLKMSFNSYCVSYLGTEQSENKMINFTYDKDNHYYGLIDEGIWLNLNTYHEGFKCKQNFAIYKDGQWIKDLNTGRNFEIKL